MRTRVGGALVAVAVAVAAGAHGRPLSDVAPISLAGVPVVSLITTPIYLFDPRDTPDKVDRDGMTRVRAAATRTIESTASLEETRADP